MSSRRAPAGVVPRSQPAGPDPAGDAGSVAAGLWGAFLPAFSYLPAAGFDEPSLIAWRKLFAGTA